MTIRFAKYHALGNDYLVIEGSEFRGDPDPETVRRLCDRHTGVGADGILIAQPIVPGRSLELRIFNPDGSEAEKSGNGLRIYVRYLHDHGRVATEEDFVVQTKGGAVVCRMLKGARGIAVEMGHVSFDSEAIPVAGPKREVIAEDVEIDGHGLHVTCATIGNPHCVVHGEEVTEGNARRLGPAIENAPLFPNRTNVQLVEVLDEHRIRIEIWERGAGYTLASGSSACAAAAACCRRGLCRSPVRVVMPGGKLEITVAEDFTVTMVGPASKICDGVLAASFAAA